MWDCHSCDPGSNPGPGVQPSVRIPTTSIIDHKNNKDHIINSETTATISIVQQQQQKNIISSDKYKVAKLFEKYQMRDLYNRKKKLDYWTDRIHKDLDEYDKKDVLKFLEIMQEKDQSILTIIRCISIVIQIRKQIDKPLSKFTKEDIKTIFQWMNIKKYKVETVEMSQYAMHNSPKYYADPDSFVPERWTKEFLFKLPRFAYFPFGGGIRSCIGETFAVQEGILALATIFQRWKILPTEEKEGISFEPITLFKLQEIRI